MPTRELMASAATNCLASSTEIHGAARSSVPEFEPLPVSLSLLAPAG